jgi:hypothetical protein
MLQILEIEDCKVADDNAATFDLVIGEREKEIPEHAGTVMGSDPISCRSWYCC